MNDTGIDYVVYSNKDLKAPIYFNCSATEVSPVSFKQKREGDTETSGRRSELQNDRR